jgi:(p)ppGpp synthase/HD superfamily hydrolase
MEKIETIDRSVFDWEKIYFLKHLRAAFFSRPRTEEEKIQFEKDFRKISIAFDLASECHKNETRDSWEPYITHPIAVAEILLKEFEKTNANQIMIALLHDVIESNPDYEQIIKKRLWTKMCDHVMALTKKEVTTYLRPREAIITYPVIKLYDQLIIQSITSFAPKFNKDPIIGFLWNKILGDFEKELKQRRNKDYLASLKSLEYDELCVKIADRIHNLRTLGNCKPEKILRVTEDTVLHFLDKKVGEKCPGPHSRIADELVRMTKENNKKRVAEIERQAKMDTKVPKTRNIKNARSTPMAIKSVSITW